jgi:hypothetical protein
MKKLAIYCLNCGISCSKDKSIAIPAQALTGPEDNRRLRFPDFKRVDT